MMRSLGTLLLILAGGTPSLAAGVPVPETVAVPAGPFIEGSSVAQREYAYQLDEAAYGDSRSREGEWYESETSLQSAVTDAFAIMTNLVSNPDYARFVEATGHRRPYPAGWPQVHPDRLPRTGLTPRRERSRPGTATKNRIPTDPKAAGVRSLA
jgi:formylglycine-generating enzyme required for sulfatase activity